MTIADFQNAENFYDELLENPGNTLSCQTTAGMYLGAHKDIKEISNVGPTPVVTIEKTDETGMYSRYTFTDNALPSYYTATAPTGETARIQVSEANGVIEQDSPLPEGDLTEVALVDLAASVAIAGTHSQIEGISCEFGNLYYQLESEQTHTL